MPTYDYMCKKCGVFEVVKKMSDPDPEACPVCGEPNPEMYFGNQNVSVTYANRPPWTYKECLKYRTCSSGDGRKFKVDPSRHGDIGAWNSPGDAATPGEARNTAAYRAKRHAEIERQLKAKK
jgi:putative FmdB family regulatory protein